MTERGSKEASEVPPSSSCDLHRGYPGVLPMKNLSSCTHLVFFLPCGFYFNRKFTLKEDTVFLSLN